MIMTKRDILEINKFQLRVLTPFYVATLLAAVFFAAMVYSIFFFPDEVNVQTVLLTRCEPQVPVFLVVLAGSSLLFSSAAFFLANRNQPRQGEAEKREETNLLVSFTAGLAFIFSVVLLTFLTFQKFIAPHINPASNYWVRPIHPYQLAMIAAGLGVMVLMVWLFYWAYGLTNKVLGPYERIMRDLDKMIDENSQNELTVRPGDEMFGELAKRINLLVKKQK